MLDWWLGGTGETEAGGSDKNAYRDEYGCPALPASQVKGTLRETAELWAGWSEDNVSLFFGARAVSGKGPSAEGHLLPGAEAALPLPLRKALSTAPHERARLFASVPQTAINPATGTAKDRSLRQIEVAVPMLLELPIRWQGALPPPDGWISQLDSLCALTPAFGALKQDGFGRCVADCSELKEAAV
jgi:hypothetical protein